MWPIIKRKNDVGYSFDEAFFTEWGPTYMYYFNEDIFCSRNEIKSIVGIYEYSNAIKFDPRDFAMGLHYECGEFGQHVLLFSYEDVPKIDCRGYWKYYVYPNFSGDDSSTALFNRVILKYGKNFLYEKFLSSLILSDDVLETEKLEKLQKASHKILDINNISNNPKYINLLEMIYLSLETMKFNERDEWLFDFLNSNDSESHKILLKPLKPGINFNREKLKKQYNYINQRLYEKFENNNLNLIFENCRNLFLNDVVQYDEKEKELEDFNGEKQKIKILCPKYGSLIKDNDKAIFVEDKKRTC